MEYLFGLCSTEAGVRTSVPAGSMRLKWTIDQVSVTSLRRVH